MDTPDKAKAREAWKFLASNRLASIATLSVEDNAPQASLIYYMIGENFHIYIVTAKDSRKFKNISKNNKIALVVGQEMEPLVLQIDGVAEVVEDEDKKHQLSSQYLEMANSNTKTPNWPPVMKLSTTGGYVFMEITVTKFKFSDFSGLDNFITEGTSKDWI